MTVHAMSRPIANPAHFYKVLYLACTIAILTYGYVALTYLPLDEWIRRQYGGHSQYLTIQSLALTWLTMVMGVVTEWLPVSKYLKFARRMSLLLALPLEIIVSLIYWSLLVLFPHLLLQPSGLQASTEQDGTLLMTIPLHIDLALHAVPSLSLLIDFFLFESKYEDEYITIVAPTAFLSFALWYASWVEHCAEHNEGTFPYPFLTTNPFKIRLFIYAFVTGLAYTTFRLVNYFNPHVERRPRQKVI